MRSSLCRSLRLRAAPALGRALATTATRVLATSCRLAPRHAQNGVVIATMAAGLQVANNALGAHAATVAHAEAAAQPTGHIVCADCLAALEGKLLAPPRKEDEEEADMTFATWEPTLPHQVNAPHPASLRHGSATTNQITKVHRLLQPHHLHPGVNRECT